MGVVFEIVTPAGFTSCIFDSEVKAREYVLARKRDIPGLRIDRVERFEIRTNVYRPRASKAASA